MLNQKLISVMRSKAQKIYDYLAAIICISIPFMTYAKAFANIVMISMLIVTFFTFNLKKIKQFKINVIHAGLECGIIGSHYPKMDMISFGPTILGAHSPDEKASISSTQKFWKFFKEIINNIPEKTN